MNLSVEYIEIRISFLKLREKGVEFVSLKEQLDTNTPQGRFMLTVFAAMAELERETILQRQREGIAAAKRAGKYKGRQPIKIDETVLRRECQKWRAGEQTAKETMRKLGIKPNTFYRRVKALGLCTLCAPVVSALCTFFSSSKTQ